MDAEKHPGITALATTVPLEVGQGDEINEKKPALVESSTFSSEDKQDGDVVIRTAQDVATHFLSLRDDFDPALTFRSMVLSTGLAAFQAVMYQIYMFKSTAITIQGTFIVIIAFFLGKGWAKLLPRGDLQEARWRSSNGDGKLPLWIKVVKFINPRPWSLKEHAICAITATSASNAAAGTQVFAAQKLFYDMPLEASTVICTTISIGLFGYGLCGLLRPITVYHVDAVYWGTLPTVKTLQGLNWNNLKDSKPLRVFWYCLSAMFVYEFLPAYVWPWLNSISIPCLASMHATGLKAETLTRLFGGATNNEGLGLFSISLDWQYVTSFQTSLPLVLQVHQVVGFIICYVAMLIIYYCDIWGAKSLPFMSTKLRSAEGGSYPSAKLFVGGVLSQTALAQYGLPRLSGTFAYSLFMANAAIGALITHVILFLGKDIVATYKSARKGVFNDRHHTHMVKHYKEAPWWWYVLVLVVSFALGLIVVLKNNITLSAWAYVVALILGCIIAPFSTIIYSRYGNGIATNNLSKMLAGLMVPERPVGNMYFAAWSHNVISNTVNLSNDLKMGEYLKIPPRVMFLTQCWGTIFGGFISYVVMVSIVTSNAEVLTDGNGNASWSGATMQSYNTNATAWAMASYLYKAGQTYFMVPVGIAVGAALVVVHRIFAHFVPSIRGVATSALNLPQLIQYAGYLPYNQTQTCVILTWVLSGFFVQFYLRNYKPGFFKEYVYMIMGAFDGASLLALFILSFAVFGAAGVSKPFPQWWGNNVAGNYDLCPVPE